MKYYVYGYFREDGTPYYIGKGCLKRAWAWHRVIKKPADPSRIRILLDGMTEEEALEAEKDLISLLGRKKDGTGCLWNLTDGGQGSSGWRHSQEVKDRISRLNKGRLAGRPQSEEHKRRKAESCRQPLTWAHDDFGTITCSAVELSAMFNKPNRHKLSMVRHGKRMHTKGWRIGLG